MLSRLTAVKLIQQDALADVERKINKIGQEYDIISIEVRELRRGAWLGVVHYFLPYYSAGKERAESHG